MALLRDLPNELLVIIIRLLIARRIDHFDPVATKELQSLRLASQRLNGMATPILFENMVLDFSFWKLNDMKRVIHFAKGNPGLAKQVRRLQLRTPATTSFSSTVLCPGSTLAEFQSHLDGCGLLKAFELNEKQVLRIFELVVTPVEAQWEKEIPNFDAIRKLMRETVAVLPQVYHVENAVSLHESERTARVYQQVWEEMGIDISGYFPTVSANQSAALGRGVSYVMTALTNHITSLKLREVPFENWLYHWRIPDQVAHLDIELTVGQQFGILKDPLQTSLAVQDWRNQFTALKRLKTLRLHCSSQGLYPNEDEWFQTGGPDLYFDDLLTGASLPEDHLQTAIIAELESPKHERIIREADTVVIKTRTFPHLESLTLINCPLRQDGLLYLAAMHRLTLRNVELRRVVFDADPGVASVKGLARSCKLHLPHLRHLVLWKIDLYCPEGDLAGSDAREDVASVYRWDRGEGGGGDGLVRYAWDLERVVEAGVGARSLEASNVVS